MQDCPVSLHSCLLLPTQAGSYLRSVDLGVLSTEWRTTGSFFIFPCSLRHTHPCLSGFSPWLRCQRCWLGDCCDLLLAGVGCPRWATHWWWASLGALDQRCPKGHRRWCMFQVQAQFPRGVGNLSGAVFLWHGRACQEKKKGRWRWQPCDRPYSQ